MAHEKQRALELDEEILQQVERLHVEIVRRLVHHEQVERPREQPRQQQAIALAAGQRAHRRAGTIGGEEEVLQIAMHMAPQSSDGHELRPIGDAVEHAPLGVELLAQLIEVRDLQTRAEPDRATIRRQLAEQETKQRGLAGAIRADDTDTITARDRRREIADDHPVTAREAHAACLHDQTS